MPAGVIIIPEHLSHLLNTFLHDSMGEDESKVLTFNLTLALEQENTIY